MQKKLRITESELVKIISTIISEQSNKLDCSQNINPQNLVYGDGGNNSPKKRPYVVALQKKLQQLNLLKLKDPNNPSGFFGNNTKAALEKYNELCKSSNTKTGPSWSDYLKSIAGGTKILPSFLPLHHKCALRFAAIAKTPLTEADLSDENLKVLSDMICQKAIRLKSCDPSKWKGEDKRGVKNKNHLLYEDMSIYNKKSPSYGKSSFTYEEQPTDILEIMFTVGTSEITKTGSGWLVVDRYNFDKILKSKPYLKTEGFFDSISNIVKGLYHGFTNMIQGKSPVAGFEETLSQLHNFGYNGYPVKINVPSYGCKCKP
jgi:hypothetical protein